MLKPGGMILYSTCTFSPEENEQTIEYLLQEYPEFELCEIEGYEGFSSGIPEASVSGDERLRRTVRIFPHRMEGEGHFLALLKKAVKLPPERMPERRSESRLRQERERFPMNCANFSPAWTGNLILPVSIYGATKSIICRKACPP